MADVPEDFVDRVATAVGSEPTAVAELDGGEIGVVRRVDLADGRTVVAKTGDAPLTVEARMLRYLETESDLPVPGMLHADNDLLVLEYVDGRATFTPAVERDAADRLAALHDVSAPTFGFPFDTLVGSVDLPNPWTDSWVEFYRDRRVEYAAGLVRESGRLPPSLAERVGEFADALDGLLVEPDAPGLVHGDLWTGNVLADPDAGEVRAFLDPACYYAHPEIELAYVDWTGTFGEAFFDRYRERRGIASGFFPERRDAYAVYPLLVHVYYFGESYVPELGETLSRLDF
ncbi:MULTISPECIES: fructosamine kinase family protein [Halorussus]|uniref:fructosamine kinase family protein n=1 Tax=Halorussus TaxID=1070314 RepID=UPI0020A1E466|nr:fructosamine kinase family protein [Halorussus vallis]USZ77173.1 fructosamine kinase family protein [Halorussus vallis]